MQVSPPLPAAPYLSQCPLCWSLPAAPSLRFWMGWVATSPPLLSITHFIVCLIPRVSAKLFRSRSGLEQEVVDAELVQSSGRSSEHGQMFQSIGKTGREGKWQLGWWLAAQRPPPPAPTVASPHEQASPGFIHMLPFPPFSSHLMMHFNSCLPFNYVGITMPYFEHLAINNAQGEEIL